MIRSKKGDFSMKLLQFCTPVDAFTLQKSKLIRETPDERLAGILYNADRSNNEAVGWFCLAMAREYLCAVPVRKDSRLDDLYNRILYLPDFCNFVEALNRHCFCRACNKLSCMVQLHYIRYEGIRDAVLHILAEYLDADYAQKQGWIR